MITTDFVYGLTTIGSIVFIAFILGTINYAVMTNEVNVDFFRKLGKGFYVMFYLIMGLVSLLMFLAILYLTTVLLGKVVHYLF